MLLYITGMVKKCGLLKIVHDHFKRTRQGEDPVLAEYIGSFEAAVESNKDIDGLISKNQVTSLFIVFLVKCYSREKCYCGEEDNFDLECTVDGAP